MQNRFAWILLAQVSLICSLSLHARDAEYTQQTTLEKQPVFLFCPHIDSVSSWSLYVVVDHNDPTHALALGLEELTGKNSKQNTYNGVLKAQKDPRTQRSGIAQLNAADFGRAKLEVKENNMLAIDVTPLKDGSLRLAIDARVGVDQHFMVGGQDRNRRDIVLQYSRVTGCWQTRALSLENKDGRNAVGRFALPLTGIVFTGGALSISRIAAVDDLGKAILLMDR